MDPMNRQPVFRVEFNVSARKLRNAHDREGEEIKDSRQQVFKDFYNPMLPQAGQRARMLPGDDLMIKECHFDTDRDLWIVRAADVTITAIGELTAREELKEWLRQIADAGWMIHGQTGTGEVIEIAKGDEEDYGDTELAGP